MDIDTVLRWFHLVAAAVWVGGLIVMGAVINAVRRAGAERSLLQAAARGFGRVSWTAMVVAVMSGIWQLNRLEFSLSEETGYAGRLLLKLLLVGMAVSLASVHQFTARRTSPAVRGLIQAVILLSSLGIVAAAVSL